MPLREHQHQVLRALVFDCECYGNSRALMVSKVLQITRGKFHVQLKYFQLTYLLIVRVLRHSRRSFLSLVIAFIGIELIILELLIIAVNFLGMHENLTGLLRTFLLCLFFRSQLIIRLFCRLFDPPSFTSLNTGCCLDLTLTLTLLRRFRGGLESLGWGHGEDKEIDQMEVDRMLRTRALRIACILYNFL